MREVTTNPAILPVAANRDTSIQRQHVESEQSLASVVEFPSERFDVENFCQVDGALTQTLGADSITGEHSAGLYSQRMDRTDWALRYRC